MPPSLLLLALIAIAIPTAARALLGRPRLLLAALGTSLVGAIVAQAAGELTRVGVGVIGDTQLAAAVAGSVVGTALVMLVEPRRTRARA
jgi:membrane associated rhomboid family serine protease